MPATEQTWRSQKLLHKIFAATSLLLLFATLWMFWKDSDDEWKIYQATARNVDLQLNEWQQLQFKTDETAAEHDRLQRAIRIAKSAPVDEELYAEFKAQVQKDAEFRSVDEVEFEWLDKRVGEQQKAGTEAQEAREKASASELELEEAINAIQTLQLEIPENETAIKNFPAELEAAKKKAAGSLKDEADAIASFKADYAVFVDAVTAAEKKLADAGDDATAKAAAEKELESAKEELEENNFYPEEIKNAEIELEKAIAAGAEKVEADMAGKLEGLKSGVEANKARLEELSGKLSSLRTTAKETDAAAIELEENASELRENIVADLQEIIDEARFREDQALTAKKFKSADVDALKGNLGIGVRDSLPEEALEELQREVTSAVVDPGGLNELTAMYEHTTAHRKKLLAKLRQITAGEAELSKELETNMADLARLSKAYEDKKATFLTLKKDYPWVLGKRVLELPILDAFNSPLKIDNLWNDDLTIDYNFRQVRRYDRCTTCHQMMNKTLPGSPVDPAYPDEMTLTFIITPPSTEELNELREERAKQREADGNQSAHGSEEIEFTLQDIYGLQLAPEGVALLDEEAVTISFVAPGSLGSKARKAPKAETLATLSGGEIEVLLDTPWGKIPNDHILPGLLVGDVIEEVDGSFVSDREDAVRMLMNPITLSDEVGQPLTIKVRRGLPNPYSSHPRLDLFIGSTSPHPMSVFGCTTCHEGQGSATAFKYASHAPNTPDQEEEWMREHGYFDNHHWIYPQWPERFQQSSCLKCHHDVTELAASERFPDPPAPKVVHGGNVIKKYGCYGCHEINGYDGQDRIGPDMRSEPMVFAAAQQILSDPNYDQLKVDEQADIAQLVHTPEDDAARRRVYNLLVAENKLLADKDAKEEPRLTPTSIDLAALMKDSESPGKLRKAGPSLRFAGSKLSPTFMFDWIKEPKHFRPSSRMPQFFGLHDHLETEEAHDTQEIEEIEILGITAYLLERSQEYTPEVSPIKDDARSEEERIASGEVLFKTNGCLACHSHETFPDAELYNTPNYIQQGPDLTNLGEKFKSDLYPGEAGKEGKGKAWLYSWIKNPSGYHVRTVMPDLMMTPKSVDGSKDGAKIDPISDIVDFLMHDEHDGHGYKPAQPPAEFNADGKLTSIEEAAAATLDTVALRNLEDAFYGTEAKRFSQGGIPASEAAQRTLKGAEVELIVPDDADVSREALQRQKLLYVGSKAIAKYGCYGCHDIPGFEAAKPIGTGLADWGRKNTSQLAFEHIAEYLHHGHGHASHEDEEHHGDDGEHEGDDHDHDAGEHANGHADSHADEGAEPLPPYYEKQLMSGSRIGFIFQKLREPRSYDYHKVENKKYNERLRMPQFPINDVEREAVVTFVLGLVADPPPSKFVYTPDPRQKAILEGQRVIEKYNCSGCHVFDLEEWEISFPPGHLEVSDPKPNYPFVSPLLPPKTLEASAKRDRRGMLSATIRGLPSLAPSGYPEARDPLGDQIDTRASSKERYAPYSLGYKVTSWEPFALDGKIAPAASAWEVNRSDIDHRNLTRGGFLSKYLLPYVAKNVKNAEGSKAWERVPPPLAGEGKKVQTDWLHDFLLDPHPIRPLVLLRMPKFNMSSEEASILVNYFAAKDNADFPYEYNANRRQAFLDDADAAYRAAKSKDGAEEGEPGERFDDAMNIVTNICVKCHPVGDYSPEGPQGPDLSDVYVRLRHDWVRNWIANPPQYLPYTSMPVNIPFDPEKPHEGGVDQKYYHGTSTEQLQALTDLLMNFDRYTRQQTKIAPLVPAQLPGDDAASDGGEGDAKSEAGESEEPAEPTESEPEVTDTSGGILKGRFVFGGMTPEQAKIDPKADAEFCGKHTILDESLVVADDNSLKNVVVWMHLASGDEPPPAVEPSDKPVVIDNKDCRFEPHISLVQAGQTLEVKNSDKIVHSSLIDFFASPPISVTVPIGGKIAEKLLEEERLPNSVTCAIHPWMKGWVLVKEHPYFAVSDDKGEFTIRNIPPGDWNFRFWHEKAGYLREVEVAGKPTEWSKGILAVNIAEGKTNDLGVVTTPAELFED